MFSQEMIDKMMKTLSPEQREQVIKTNKAFREMSALDQQLTDLTERLEIARAVWNREDRLWRQILIENKFAPNDVPITAAEIGVMKT